MIESLLKSVFKKIGRQKVKLTVYFPNSTKIQRVCWRCSNYPILGSFVTKLGNESNHFCPFQQITSNNLYVKSFRFLPSFILVVEPKLAFRVSNYYQLTNFYGFYQVMQEQLTIYIIKSLHIKHKTLQRQSIVPQKIKMKRTPFI